MTQAKGDDRREEIRRNMKVANVAVALLVLVALAVACVGLLRFFGGDGLNLNELGDFLAGTSGVLLAGAGVTLIYSALQAQLLEIAQQRDELAVAKEQLHLQNRHLTRQRDETTFFSMVGLHRDIVREADIRPISPQLRDGKLKFSDVHEVVSGRAAFERIYRILKETWKISRKASLNHDEVMLYERIYRRFQGELGHYFRNLYHIIKFVDRSELDDKKAYTNVIRAQLSSSELNLLYYNCLSRYGRRKFKPLVEEYELLENMPQRELLTAALVKKYDEQAFGDRSFAALPPKTGDRRRPDD